MAILVTGAAGFVGFHVAAALLDRGEQVVGIDNLNDYYDVRLKQARLSMLQGRNGFSFHRLDISDRVAMAAVADGGITGIVHLAAQAGVRHSMVDPYSYVTSNVMGHLVVLEVARGLKRLEHLVYASPSSVYGANAVPFSESDRVDTPMSLYAATKRADELMSYSYAHLYGIPQSGLRFFTVYGPWGRPDMAYFSFAAAIMQGRPITVYDEGRPLRDFTYIDDIVAGVLGCLDRPPTQSAKGEPPQRIVNIGNNRSETVASLIAALEESLGKRAILTYAPRPKADVAETCARIDDIAGLTGFAPRTPLSQGIRRFAAWFLTWRADDVT